MTLKRAFGSDLHRTALERMKIRRFLADNPLVFIGTARADYPLNLALYGPDRTLWASFWLASFGSEPRSEAQRRLKLILDCLGWNEYRYREAHQSYRYHIRFRTITPENAEPVAETMILEFVDCPPWVSFVLIAPHRSRWARHFERCYRSACPDLRDWCALQQEWTLRAGDTFSQNGDALDTHE